MTRAMILSRCEQATLARSSDEPALCTLALADDDSALPIEVLDALPSGRSLRLVICRGGVHSRTDVSALPGSLLDVASGELVADSLRHIRLRWARRICAAHGGWPLHQLIAALLVGECGPTTAADLALALGTWERFAEALDQLSDAALPASREELVLAHNARGRPVGVFEPTPDALDHARGLYAEPLAILLDACGPRTWRSLRSFALSAERASDVAHLLAIARPLPFGPEDYDAFLRERFGAATDVK